MYNKYFTMKRSELKEAIKAEITSVLSEAMSSSAIEKLLSQIEKEKNKPERMKSIIKSLTGLVNRGKYDQIEALRAVLNKFKDLNIKLNESVLSENRYDINDPNSPLGKLSDEYESSGLKGIVDNYGLDVVLMILSSGEYGDRLNESILSEEIQVGDIVTLGGDGDELEVIDSREMFGSDMMAYRVKFPDGNTEEYSADQLRPARMMNEGKRGVVVDPDEIMMHINQYQDGNIDGDDLAQAIEEILVAMMNKSVTFSDIREEDEPTDAEIKKADSVASAANKLQKLVKKMKDKAKDFKAAEGEAKEKIKDELKAMTAEKKKLEKSI